MRGITFFRRSYPRAFFTLSPRSGERVPSAWREAGEGRLKVRALSPPLRGDPLPQAGEGKERVTAKGAFNAA